MRYSKSLHVTSSCSCDIHSAIRYFDGYLDAAGLLLYSDDDYDDDDDDGDFEDYSDVDFEDYYDGRDSDDNSD